MSNANCNNCIYRCSCQGVRKVRTEVQGYCFDYQHEESWMNRMDLLLNLALGIGLSAVLIAVMHFVLCL